MENILILNQNKSIGLDKQYEEIFKKNNLIIEDGIWIYSSVSYNLDQTGYKIHLSATPTNILAIAEIVINYFKEKDISYKMIKSINDLILLNKGNYGYSQIGKAFTVYPKDTNHFKKTIFDLHLLTKQFRSIQIPSDFRFLNSEIVYYRFGELLSGNTQSDDSRTRILPLESDYTLPYHNIKRYSELPDYLTPIKSLGGSGKSSIILVFNSNEQEYMTLKIGRRLGNIEDSLVDSSERVAWEYYVLNDLSELTHLVNPVDIFYLNEDVCLLEEYIPGSSLFELVYKKQELNGTNVSLICKQLLSAVKEIHEKNYIIGDLSLGNIIFNGRQIKIIDTEYFFKKNTDFYYLEVYKQGTLGFWTSKYKDKNRDLYAVIKIFYFLCNPKEYLELAANNRELSIKEMDNIDSLSNDYLTDFFGIPMDKLFTYSYESILYEIEKRISKFHVDNYL